MDKASSSAARRLGANLLRLGGLCLGTWLAAVLPVEVWAEHQRAANAAAGMSPNMDPGAVAMMAAVMALVPLSAALLIELVRAWAMRFNPLALPSCVALGALSSWPLGWAFSLHAPGTAKALLVLGSAMGFAAFYSVRWAWLVNRERDHSSAVSRQG